MKPPPPPHTFTHWLAASAAVWLIFGVAMVLSAHGDASRQGSGRPLLGMAAELLPYLGPLVLYSAVIGRVLARDDRLGAWAALRLWLLSLALFTPLNAIFHASYTAWRRGPAAWLDAVQGWQQLQQAKLMDLWVDSMIASGAFAALLAWSIWRHRQSDEQRWHEAQADNLRLRLQRLQGQLEPHFLFNALNSVSALVRSGERTTALGALEQISSLLRLALRASRTERISVADELDFARTYLDVQRLRFGDALTVAWDLEAAGLDDLACPPLLLQPLIENAVVHGLESNQGRGRIDVAVRSRAATPATAGEAARGAELVIRIANSLGPDKPCAGHGLGLAATRERLRLLYGTRAALRLDVGASQHVAELTVPAEALA